MSSITDHSIKRQMTCTSTNQTSQASNTIADEILDAHNRYRAEVGVPPLSWSDDLANQAQDWANYLAANSVVIAQLG